MMRAIRAVSSERGRDPREYALFAFGGNGPLFAAGMAAALEMERIVVPPAPGLFSSFGLLYSDVAHHAIRSHRRLLRAVTPEELRAIWEEMEIQARAQLAREGFHGPAAQISRSADLRYQGQSFELTVPAPADLDGGEAIAGLEAAFGREHERTYGHRAGPDEPVEIVSLRVVGRGVPDSPRVPERLEIARAAPAGEARRRVYFGPEHGWLETPILGRGALQGGRPGPCIVEEYDATCVVPPGARAALDRRDNIVIDLPTPGRRRP
jgi:N-methylhydantoinase A